MRDSLSCDVELRHFGVWRCAVAAVAIAALASLAAWAVSGSEPWPTAWNAGAVAAGIAVVLLALRLGRVERGRLRREDGRWTSMPDRGVAAPEAGELAVALDLGSFVLLSFSRSGKTGKRVRRWLPVQRGGPERDWHALRCAMYAPSPPAGERVTLDEPLPE
ncbi:MAG: hypothetical protein ABJA61_06160 [Caldimonas sp.]